MKKLLLVLALLGSGSAFAGQCDNLYPDNKPLVPINATELCSSFYVSVYDTSNKKVLYTSELLKQGAPIGTVKREDSFRGDSRISNSPVPSQYAHSGYDKGHMAPAGDASSSKEMFDTFLMTNMTPQEPTLNRQSWRLLEEKVRGIAAKAGTDVKVVTVAVYGDNKMMKNIPVPTGYWKIVYVKGSTMYFYADNKPHAAVVQRSGVALSSLIK